MALAANGALVTRSGGSVTLSADVDFGGSKGLKVAYLKTQTTNPASAGVLRLAKTDTVAWRSNANGADLALAIDGSDNLTFNGTKVGLSGNIVNADISGSAAIAYSKLALTGAILNADLAGSIAYSKLTLTGSIVNADVSASAAIAYSKLNLAGAVKLASDVTGLLPAANGGTGVLSTATFPSSGVVVTEAATETLTNKTLTSPVISTIVNTGTLTLPTATDTLVARTTTDTLTNKTISGSSNTITNVSLTTGVTGTLPIGNGGTGQTAKTAAYNALTPLTTKGDLVGFDGTNGVRVAVGADGTVLSSDSTQTAGLKWVSPLTNPMTTQGDLIVGGSSGAATRLAAGTNGQRLRTAGSGATPTYGWESTVTKTANYTITDTDGYDVVLGDATSGNVTITLPAAANNSGRKLVIKKIDSSTNTVAISSTIDGGTSNNTIKQQYGWGAVVSNGTGWYWVSDIQETGAWSPSLALSGSNPSGASSTGTWSYSRNGRIVTVQFYINFTALGSGGAGNLNYSGLPFTSRNPGSASWIGAVATNAVASLTNKFIVAAVSNNSAVLSFSYGGSSASSVSWSEISTGVWYTTVTYFIA